MARQAKLLDIEVKQGKQDAENSDAGTALKLNPLKQVLKRARSSSGGGGDSPGSGGTGSKFRSMKGDDTDQGAAS